MEKRETFLERQDWSLHEEEKSILHVHRISDVGNRKAKREIVRANPKQKWKDCEKGELKTQHRAKSGNLICIGKPI